MDDPGMVSMFQAIMESGLEGFLGCPAIIYEAYLVDFFEKSSVRDGVIISTVAGQLVEISEEWFAESFDLPVDGLADLSEIPKDVVFYARSIVSMSGEPVSLSGKKSQLKIEYRLLCDIMAKSISVKAGSFNAITVETFSMLTAVVCGVRMNWASVLFNILKKMVTPGSKQAKGFAVQISLLLENIPNLELGESSEFPASKILTEKTVHRYFSLNDKVGAEKAAGAPKPKAASKKRPAAVLGDEPMVKKKRTMKKKSSSSKVNLEIVAVAQEAVPIMDTAAAASISLPAAPIPDVTKPLNQLRASIEQISERDDGAKHKDTLLLHLHHLERNLTACLDAHDRVLGALRRDSNDQRNLMSMDIKSSHKQLSTQIASDALDVVDVRRVVRENHQELNTKVTYLEELVAATRHDLLDFIAQAQQTLNDKQLSTQIASDALDVVDVRRVVRENHQELNTKVTYLEELVAATRHDLLDFIAQAQQTLNVITDQLSELVAYINCGVNDKKGEVSSSRPQPDNQNRGSGNTGGGGDIVRTTDITQRYIDNAQRNILERLMSADRARERERRSKSRSGSGSYKRRR
ncbi:dystroglycan-like [Dorcoceras hygrometricum]|uniref:Dystroglycan-like n=1 Tax=Dorcoceras hygrometricum TaxID=472368 RepID=A0A2Z7CP73_9LAMI|nr:dystroglycan-like [Dorcoceras hygrometricum]